MFNDNFKKYEHAASDAVKSGAPKLWFLQLVLFF
jgi:hypothetical protein